VKLCTGDVQEYLLRKSKFDYNFTKTLGTSHGDHRRFVCFLDKSTKYFENVTKGTHACVSMATHANVLYRWQMRVAQGQYEEKAFLFIHNNSG
jgi:hypothetical protein